jgi:GT2 family glycosyltransferase
MRLSVIIPVHDGGIAFQGALEALAAALRPTDDVIVVDDGSTDDSATVARRCGARVLSVAGGPRGPAVARNQGAAAAHGEILVFLDADVAVRPDTLGKIESCFQAHPEVAALFGSYDAEPPARNWASLYQNLRHHDVHQHGHREASTFWAGCGAVRKQAFFAIAGFDPGYALPEVEDIDLGLRLRRAGHRIWLCPDVQVTHLKCWTLLRLWRSDVCQRAIPWTRLILRERSLPADLNLDWRSRWSALAAWGGVGSAALGVRWPWLGLGTVLAVLIVAVLNAGLLRLFARTGGPLFAVAGLGLQALYFLYSSAVFGILCALAYCRRRHRVIATSPRRLLSVNAWLASVAVVALISLAQGSRNAWDLSNDLRLRYQTARLMLAGENPHHIKATREITPGAGAIIGQDLRSFAPDYLPSAMLPMLPLALLSWGQARLVWLLTNLASALLLVGLLRRWPEVSAIPWRHFLIAVCLWIAGTPFRNNLGLGQNCVFALALTLAAASAQARGRCLLGGVLLALGLFKYAYVWPLVLFLFVLNRGWLTLLVAATLHGAAHLLLCGLMGAHPVGVLAQILPGNAYVFRHGKMLSVWMPYRTLATQFPSLHLPADVLGACALAALLAGLVLLWRRRRASLARSVGWLFVLGLLSTLALTARDYDLSYCLAGWLWLCVVPATAATCWPRVALAGGLLYLTVIHRALEALAQRGCWPDGAWMGRGFNSVLFLVCVASAILLLRTLPKPGSLGGEVFPRP